MFLEDEVFRVKGQQVKAVDATGAGDAFWSGFLSSLLMQGVKDARSIKQDALCKAMEYGNISGSLCVQKKGAISSLPTRDEVEAGSSLLAGVIAKAGVWAALQKGLTFANAPVAIRNIVIGVIVVVCILMDIVRSNGKLKPRKEGK